MLPSVFDSLISLPDLVHTDVTLTGNWSPSDSLNRTWRGEAVAEIPIVGITFLSLSEQVFWIKSMRISNALGIQLTLHPLMTPLQFQFMCYLGGFSGNHPTIATLNADDELPDIPQSQTLKTGHLFTLVRFKSTPAVEIHTMILAKQDVKVARGHIWGLRKTLRSNLMPPLVDVFSRGRKGQFQLP